MDKDLEDMSRLLDGDLEATQAGGVLAACDAPHGAARRDAWTRFALIGDVLRGNPTPDDGFTLRLLARLRAEVK